MSAIMQYTSVCCKYCGERIPLAERPPEHTDDFLPEPCSEILVRHSTHVPTSNCHESAMYSVDWDIRPIIRRLPPLGFRPHPEFYLHERAS